MTEVQRLAKIMVLKDMRKEYELRAKYNGGVDYDCYRALDMAIEELSSSEKPNRWIRVESVLPEDGKRVIWCFKDGAIGIERYKCDAIDHFYPQQGQHGLEEAVAWMPLPEPYKASPTGGESEDKE